MILLQRGNYQTLIVFYDNELCFMGATISVHLWGDGLYMVITISAVSQLLGNMLINQNSEAKQVMLA